MYKKKKICCIIPARMNSSELKKKNFKKINSVPLFIHPIKEAKKSKYIDDIYFNSDSSYMLNLAKKNGAIAKFKRPNNLSKNESKISDVLQHHFEYYDIEKKFDYFILLEPTSPLTTYKEIDSALKKIINNKKASSLVSITSKTIPNFSMKVRKKIGLLYPEKNISLYKTRRQDLKKEYYICGALYISKIKSFIKYKNFVQPKTAYYELHKFNAFEIDDLIDFNIVKFLYRNKRLKHS